jgi:hypothetical protein
MHGDAELLNDRFRSFNFRDGAGVMRKNSTHENEANETVSEVCVVPHHRRCDDD